MSSPARRTARLVSVIIPLLDEEDCVDELVRRLVAVFEEQRQTFELLLIDDGSQDATPERIAALATGDARIKTVRFTRSFGHQAALLAGLRFASGDAMITMDGDLQHPPELISELLERWRDGADVVQALRRDPEASSGSMKAATSRLFYRIVNVLGGITLPVGSADFRLLDRRAVRAIAECPEHFLFLRGLVPWLGFRSVEVSYVAAPRHAGISKFDLRRMIRLALSGIFAFSVVPLRLIALLGLFTTLAGVGFGVFALVSQLAGRTQTGWTSLTILILIFGGVQLLSLGIVSEYVGRTYEEAKRRPRYVIDRVQGLEWE